MFSFHSAALFHCVVAILQYTGNAWYSYGVLRLYHVLSGFSSLMFQIALALILCMFIDFVAALSYVKNGSFSKKVRNVQLACSILVGVVILLLAVTLALRFAINFSDDESTLDDLRPHLLRLDAGICVIFLIFSAVAVFAAIGAVIRFKKMTQMPASRRKR